MQKMQVWSKWLETGEAFSSYLVDNGDDVTADLEIAMAVARTKMWGHCCPSRADELTAGLVERGCGPVDRESSARLYPEGL